MSTFVHHVDLFRPTKAKQSTARRKRRRTQSSNLEAVVVDENLSEPAGLPVVVDRGLTKPTTTAQQKHTMSSRKTSIESNENQGKKEEEKSDENQIHIHDTLPNHPISPRGTHTRGLGIRKTTQKRKEEGTALLRFVAAIYLR